LREVERPYKNMLEYEVCSLIHIFNHTAHLLT
jgi:hypothetical protein